MNAVGRQMSRSGSTAHHHRQYSDNFIDASLHGKWLLSANLSQDFGVGPRGSRSSRSLLSSNPGTPPVYSRSSSLRRNEDDQTSHGLLGSGLLDLHSFDTELLPQVSSNLYDEYPSLHQPVHGGSFVFEPHVSSDKLNDHVLPENNLLRSFVADKERVNNVAKIKVVVRKRPLNRKEIAKKEQDIITIELNSSSLTVQETKLKVDLTEYVEKHEFVFDAVLNESVSNDEVYSETVQPIVPLIFNRTKATCFAYGQTGSGKTYTMQPLPLKASQDILRLMHHTYQNQGLQLFVSFFEIYGGKLFDLLNDRRKLCMREDGKQQVCIVGLQEFKVSNVETIRELIELGNATRSTGTTGANEESSRSHAILQLAIKRSADGKDSKPARLIGKLSFIDLAGSERGADTTDNDKQTRMEGAEINKSLLALKECIRALDNDQGHIPFRGSKLTEVLRDSFVGDSRTVMISCISPGSGSCEHTLNTLRYADRVKSLSKGTSSKKDLMSSSVNIRDSTTFPLGSLSAVESNFENNMDETANEKKNFLQPKRMNREASPPINVDCTDGGWFEGNVSDSLYSGAYKQQKGFLQDPILKDSDYSADYNVLEKPSRMSINKVEISQISDIEEKRRAEIQLEGRELQDFDTTSLHLEDDLNALLKEEENLVMAHRQQVEQTIEIVREEMNLLVQADQLGNPVDDYISKLSCILSEKAAGILQLQTRLAQFQKRLNERGVLVSPGV
ncbi:kinesin-like protein KIN-13B [Rhodamnia argentea]|uniref:Kinesin-like protein n=1 Tax=Rhodamnia argentea TaxID=178133 RepID=A0A8B8Q5H8_9MYRT|nr:kinesin-like protein KIN-13B [Rhodamnia argentea]